MAGYAIKEMFLTIQGEGINVGRRALFIRFAGCNLWSGREQDRAGADCTFCDTDFVGTEEADGGGRYPDAAAVAARASEMWEMWLEEPSERAFAVLTGGEPTLQVDAALIDALHEAGFELAIETNGTRPVPGGIDWICVSPKAGTQVVQRTGHELKLVWPQPGIDFKDMETWDFTHLLVQPMDGASAVDTRNSAIKFVLRHPRWRLAIQTHKLVGLR